MTDIRPIHARQSPLQKGKPFTRADFDGHDTLREHEANPPAQSSSTETPLADPAPDAASSAMARVTNLVDDVTSQPVEQLRLLRDAIDDMIRAIQARDAAIKETIAVHANTAIEVVTFKNIVLDAMGKIQADLTIGALVHTQHAPRNARLPRINEQD